MSGRAGGPGGKPAGLRLVLAMSHDLMPGLIAGSFFTHWLQWIEFALATTVVLCGGWPFFQRGWASIINRAPNMFTLIGMGTGAAYLYSTAATVAPGGRS